jgi:hypothetical protein
VSLHEELEQPEGSDSSGIAVEVTRDWGAAVSLGPRAAYDADLGVLAGAQVGWSDYAFRRDPYGRHIGLSAVYATGADGFRVDLTGELPRPTTGSRLDFLVRASSIETVRFNGLGNERTNGGDAAEVSEWQFTVAPALEHTPSEQLVIRGGPVLRYTTRASGRLGLAGSVRLGPENPDSTGRLARIGGGLGMFPVTWSGSEAFGELHAVALSSFPLPLPGSPLLVTRVGGKRIWGEFPYDEAAFLGGATTLRGYDFQRFAGDAMVNGSVELRVPVARILGRMIPTRVGVFGLGDAGRVWVEGEESRRVHAAAGAGIWLSFFNPANTLSIAWASGREGDRWYLSWGLES